MASIMRLFKNYKLFVLLCLFIWLFPVSAGAADFATEIKNAEINFQNDHYQLSADLVYKLSDKAKEALQNGVPLFWDVKVILKENKSFWWDKTWARITIRYQIQYHALLNIYRVVIVQKTCSMDSSTVTQGIKASSLQRINGDVYNFSTLSSALDFMSVLHNVSLITMVPNGNATFAEIKVSFDRDALPLPLRPIAYIEPQWYLSSDWTLWHLKK